MAEDERPPGWVPVDQSVGQVPLKITSDVDSASISPKPDQDIHALAAQIIRDNQPIINRFVAVQRQQVELGEKDVHNNVLPLVGLTVYYQNVQGLERMHYHVTPQVEEPAAIKVPEQEEVKPPEPPAPEEPPETPEIKTREPEVPEPAKPPEFEEPKPPEEEKLPEEEKPPEYEDPKPDELPEPPEPPEPPEEEERKGAPEFLSVDMMVGLAVEFSDGDD